MKKRIISAAVAILLLVAVLFASDEYKYIFNYMLIDGKKLTPFEKNNFLRMFENGVDIIRQNREMISNNFKSILNSTKGFSVFDINTGEIIELNGDEIVKFREDLEKNGGKPQDIMIVSNSKQSAEMYLEFMNYRQENESGGN